MAGTNVINDYVAGAIGGCAGMVVGHPLDTVKVQMQTQSPTHAFKGMWDCINTISQQNLSKGFFRGMSWPIVSFAFMNSAFFGMYGHILQMFGHNLRETEEPHFGSTFAAGFLATFPTVFIACPVDVIKCTLQSQIEHEICPNTGQMKKCRALYSGPLEATKDLLRRKGIRGLYRGSVIQLARDCPANAVYMSSYEICAYEANKFLPSVPNPLVNFFSGGMAGVLSWLMIMPLDVIKSRMQADTRDKYKGFADCTRQSFCQEGWRVFYRGSLAVTLRAFPVNAVTLMVYTEVLLYMNAEKISGD